MSRRLSQPTARPQAISCKISTVNTLPTRFTPRRQRNHLSLSPTVYSSYKGIRRAIAACDGCCDWPARKLAAHLGVSQATYFAHADVLEARGLLLRIRRRGAGKHNDTSLWMLPVMTTKVFHNPTPDFEREKQVLSSELKTNTRSVERTEDLPVKPEAKPGPAYSRRAENHDPAHRERWERGQHFRQYRMEQAQERNRMAMRACVGMPHTFRETTPTQAPEDLAVWQQIEARAAAERAAKAEKEQAAAEARRKRTEACEVCMGSGKRTIDRAGRPAEVTCWDCKL